MITASVMKELNQSLSIVMLITNETAECIPSRHYYTESMPRQPIPSVE